MATAPQPPRQSPPPPPRPTQSQPAPPPAPERHPADPEPAKPGVAQPDQDPANQPQEQPKPEEKVIPKEEAQLYLRGGHKLRKKGDPPEKWFAATRAFGVLCIARPVDEETEKEALEGELVLAE